MDKSEEKIEQLASPTESLDEEVVVWNHKKEFALLLALCSQYFCQMLFIVGAGVYARSIAAVVGGESLSSWPATAINILTAATIPPIARAADLWGRKWFLAVPTSLGFIGSMIVARASSMQMAIAGFVLGGASFGAQPLVHAVASETMPRKYRSFAQGACNSAIALGSLFSLLVGGALTNNNPAGFRTYWYICAGIYVLSTVMLATLYNPPPRELQLTLTFKEKVRCLDWVGFFLYIAGLVLFCLGLSYSQNPFGWTNAHILAPFLIGVVFILTLIGYEWKVKKDGLFHHGLFQNRNFPLALVAVFIEGYIFMSANIYFPYSMEIVNTGISTFRVLVCYSIAFICLLLMSFLIGGYIYRTKTVRATAMASNIGFIIYASLMASVTAKTPESHFWGYITFYGSGLGCGVITLYTTAQLSTPPELIAVTSGLMGSIRSTGGSVAVAIYGALFNQGLTSNLFPKVASAVVPLGVSEDNIGALIADLSAGAVEAALKLPGVTIEAVGAAGEALKSAYVIGFRDVFICAVAFATLGLGASAFLINPRKEFNAKIDAPLDVLEVKVEDVERDMAVEIKGGKATTIEG
ncbi:uncharacterized protein Z519_00441 [Cladophialophora bantiana CBS 173.52]|uniref:Major facilitator superfamily (MFS) profile domain-containing protein n=1 Tax=Cladophialophora bantiana (strain ATCC 10958 / CBS 173.52 / CDC B-1940 / NIH 8579) TaxID=1442370 RepID=A0A0D2HZ78_CLAB1|nr:uncharacterized protein Z519_00441 [Cladophialophora bantiana CBS 173.52]KIW98778.1 hypothetical protein Z519_00441 [Cladophialophora bantiana CBS 173.52]